MQYMMEISTAVIAIATVNGVIASMVVHLTEFIKMPLLSIGIIVLIYIALLFLIVLGLKWRLENEIF